MAILHIALMGNKILMEKSKQISDPTKPEYKKLAKDMQETLENIGANGLAAPQVHVPERLVVYRIVAHQIPPESNMKPVPWRVLINPIVTPQTDEVKPIWERCLSLPGLHGEVPRYTKVQLTAQQLDGSKIEIKASGFHAMLLQHECDHLDGVLYPMQMIDISTLSFDTELGDSRFYIPRSAEEFME